MTAIASDIPPVLLGFQARLLTTVAENAVTVYEKSRRLGISWAAAALATETAALTRAAGGMDVFYMGYNLEMAREFIDYVAMWATAFNQIATAVEEIVLKDGDKDIKAFRVSFASGFEVVALPSTARALRGKQGLVIIDEAAFCDDLEELLKAAMALLIWGGKLLIVSTHDGVDNPFNELVNDARSGRKPYALLRTTFDDGIAEGLYRRICLVKGQEWSAEGEVAWRADIYAQYGESASEELDVIPRQTGGTWIARDLIVAAEHEDAGKPELAGKGLFYIGNDIGRRRDLWDAIALERVGDVLWVREECVLKDQPFAAHDDALDDLVRRRNPVRIAMDQTGMGEKPVEDAKCRYGELRVDGVVMSSDRRLAVATAARRAFEDGKIRIPANSGLRQDILKIKVAPGATGTPRLVVARDGAGHADRAWALFLAIAAADQPAVEAWYETVETRAEARRRQRWAY